MVPSCLPCFTLSTPTATPADSPAPAVGQ
jgi:hypothetical protein